MIKTMHRLDKLYKIDSLGKLREWTMVINGNSFYAEKGLVGGKIVCDKPTITTAKNEGRTNATTKEEQALVEAKARWTKKLKEGYAKTPKEAETTAFYKPMLAQKFEDRQKEIEKCFSDDIAVWSQPKLDGIRCVIRSENWEVVARTRKGTRIDMIPHICKALREFFNEYPDAVLDGELYNHDLKHDFNKIVSLVRKQRPTRSKSETEKTWEKKLRAYADRLDEAEKLVQYWIYDIPRFSKDWNNESTPFASRMFDFQSCYMSMDDSTQDCVKLVHPTSCKSHDDLDLFYGSYADEGYEGQMVRLNCPYESKRSKSLLKRKEFQDAEYKVIDIEEGNGNRGGTAKHLVCYCPKVDKTFHSNIKGSFDYLAEILQNKDDYIGKLATIKFFELTPDGVPRFPYAIAFRDYE